jgi:hypothetical protein
MTLALLVVLALESPPRFSAGLTAGAAELKGGSGERHGHLVLGLAGTVRPVRYGAIALTYERMTESHDYGAFQLDSTVHRLGLLLEGRLPLSPRVDALVQAGPLLALRRTSLAGQTRGQPRWTAWSGLGLVDRIWWLEVRAAGGLSLGDGGPDLGASLGVAWWWR